jgi:hypothetical protein
MPSQLKDTVGLKKNVFSHRMDFIRKRENANTILSLLTGDLRQSVMVRKALTMTGRTKFSLWTEITEITEDFIYTWKCDAYSTL